MKINPLRGRLLILADTNPDQTASGLHVVRTWDPETTGTVAAVGPGEACDCGRVKACPVKEGDHVVFSYDAGQKVTIEGEEYMVLRFDDVVGVLELTA